MGLDMGILKSFDIKRLRPFRKSGNNLPPSSAEEEEKIAKLDHDLQPEEEAYVRHYVNYADLMLGTEEASTPASQTGKNGKNVVEMGPQDETMQSSPARDGYKAA